MPARYVYALGPGMKTEVLDMKYIDLLYLSDVCGLYRRYKVNIYTVP